MVDNSYGRQFILFRCIDLVLIWIIPHQFKLQTIYSKSLRLFHATTENMAPIKHMPPPACTCKFDPYNYILHQITQ